MFLCQSMIFNVRTSNRKFYMPIYRLSSPCRWKISQHLIITYNDWVKHEQTSRTVISKTDLFTPREDKFCEYLHYTPKNISIWLRSRGERNTDFVRFVQILPIFAVKRPDYIQLYQHPLISRFSNFHSCWYNCISTRKMFYIS